MDPLGWRVQEMEVQTAGDQIEKFAARTCQRLEPCQDILKTSRVRSLYLVVAMVVVVKEIMMDSAGD